MPRRWQGAGLSPATPSHGWGLARVTGRSMEPTLADGDLLLVRWGRRPRPGAVAVVRLPGDRPVAVKRATTRVLGGWWVERDSPTEGVDSWAVGAVPDVDVLGVAVARVRPRPGLLRARSGGGPARSPDTGAGV